MHLPARDRSCLQLQEVKADVEDHAKNGDYIGKTLLFCWEHKTIPYIVAKFGLVNKALHWGLDPYSGVQSFLHGLRGTLYS